MDPDDEDWLRRATALWSKASQRLERPVDRMPWTVVYDAHCVWSLNPARSKGSGQPAALALQFQGSDVVVRARRYEREISIPDKRKIASTALAFTSVAPGQRAFFVVALPSVWRKDPRIGPDEDVHAFLSGVLVHEITHTVHIVDVQRRIESIGRRYSLPKKLDDDFLQAQFSADAGYVAAYRREADLLSKAYHEADAAAARGHVREALGLAERRRREFFRGDKEYFAEVEPVFLAMEGVASWAAWSTDPRAPDDPIAFSSKFWSQQEGLLLFLLLDRFSPEWKRRVFSPEVPSPFDMLREAIEPR